MYDSGTNRMETFFNINRIVLCYLVVDLVAIMNDVYGLKGRLSQNVRVDLLKY